MSCPRLGSRGLRRLTFSLLLILLIGGGGSMAFAQRLFTVVIDAGHGGKDGGTVGHGGKEKDITLAVAKLVGSKIRASHPEVQVLYTRTTDVFVGLQARADFANKHKASLMLSIHVNSAPSSSVYGTETYVLGVAKFANNLSVAMRENKAMLLESNYKTIYRGFDPTSTESYIMFDLMQDAYFNKSVDFANKLQRRYRQQGRYSRGVRQDILWVLSQSAMPSVLTEIGFLSNANEAAFMLSESGQQTIASAIAGAFTSYYQATQGKQVSIPAREQADSAKDHQEVVEDSPKADTSSKTAPTPKEEKSPKKTTTKSKETWRVQFLSSPDKIEVDDPRFRKLPTAVERIRVGKIYGYFLEHMNSRAEAQRALRALPAVYKDAYIVHYRDGKRL